MAHFTMEFCEAVEITGGTIELGNENPTGHSRILGGYITLDHYPIFDEDYRERLNGLIIDHFYNREIGHETPSKFNLQLRKHLNLNMPYFNRMYELEKTEFDPLSTVDIKTISTAAGSQSTTVDNDGQTHTETGSNSRSVFSDLPQTMLAGDEDYASNATDANSGVTATVTNDEKSSSDTDTFNDNDSHTSGYQGHSAELLMAARDALANIDTMVLDSMEELFMGIWHSGDAATTRQGHYYGY